MSKSSGGSEVPLMDRGGGVGGGGKDSVDDDNNNNNNSSSSSSSPKKDRQKSKVSKNNSKNNKSPTKPQRGGGAPALLSQDESNAEDNQSRAQLDSFYNTSVPLVLNFPDWLRCCEYPIMATHRNCVVPLLDRLKTSIFWNLGYRMEPQSRIDKVNAVLQQQNRPLLAIDSSQVDGPSARVALGVTVGGIPNLSMDLLDMVKVSVKVHIVNANTGHYIKNFENNAIKPLITRPFVLSSLSSRPLWGDDLLFDARFVDLLSPDTLILFELIDDRPSVSMSKSTTKRSKIKKSAWGFLFPVGSNGDINVGLPSDWLPGSEDGDNQGGSENDSKVRSAKGRKNKKDRNNSNSNSNEEKGDEDNGNEGDVDDKGVKKSLSKPSGQSVFVDKLLRIQLFKYKESDGVVGYVQRQIQGWSTLDPTLNENDSKNPQLLLHNSSRPDPAYPGGIPQVYLQWRLQDRQAIENGYLSMAAGPRNMEFHAFGGGAGGLGLLGGGNIMGGTPGGPEFPLPSSMGGAGETPGGLPSAASGGGGKAASDEYLAKLKASILRRARAETEPCTIPDRVLFRLNVGPHGAMVVKYSQCGHLLAVACQSTSVPVNTIDLTSFAILSGISYNIRFYDSNTGQEVHSFMNVHQGVIYDLQWSHDDSYLLSCSTDGTVKVWDLSSILIQHQYFSSSSSSFSGGGSGHGETDDPASSEVEKKYIKVPYCYSTLRITPASFVYCAIFQEFAGHRGFTTTANHAYNKNKRPVSNYYTTDSAAGVLMRNPPPKVISGSADGTLRVWSETGGIQLGFISSDPDYEKNSGRLNPGYIPYPAHENRVQAMVLDERSRSLFTGDCNGDIIIWRYDHKKAGGWFQLLRKFRKDKDSSSSLKYMSMLANVSIKDKDSQAMKGLLASSSNMQKLNELNNINNNNNSQKSKAERDAEGPKKQGVTTLVLLRRNESSGEKSQILVMNHSPTTSLNIFNRLDYKLQSRCNGFDGGALHAGRGYSLGSYNIFTRACTSPDGRYVFAGNTFQAPSGSVEGGGAATKIHNITVWDANNGMKVGTPLSDYWHPFHIRTVAWHPKQNVIAIAAVGEGSAVVIYAADKDTSGAVMANMAAQNLGGAMALAQNTPLPANWDATSSDHHLAGSMHGGGGSDSHSPSTPSIHGSGGGGGGGGGGGLRFSESKSSTPSHSGDEGGGVGSSRHMEKVREVRARIANMEAAAAKK